MKDTDDDTNGDVMRTFFRLQVRILKSFLQVRPDLSTGSRAWSASAIHEIGYPRDTHEMAVVGKGW